MIFSSDQIPQTQDAGNLHLYVNDRQMYQKELFITCMLSTHSI